MEASVGPQFRIVATAAERAAVSSLRYRVYVEELGKHPSAADHEMRTVEDELDAVSTIFAAFDGSTPVATVRLTSVARLPTDSIWRDFYETQKFESWSEEQCSITSRLMVVPELRGSQVAAQILCMAYDHGRGGGDIFNFMHCVPSLVSTYEMMGFRRYCDGKIDPEVGFRVPMVLVVQDLDYLNKLPSPLLAVSQKYPAATEHGIWFLQRFADCTHPSSAKVLGADQFFGRFSSEIGRGDPLLLADLTESDARQVFRSAVVHSVGTGDTMIRSGDKSHDLFLILDGAVEVSAGLGSDRRVFAVLKEGQTFGELGFVSRSPSACDVRALAPVRMLSIHSSSLDRMSSDAPGLAIKLIRNIVSIICKRCYSI